MDSKKRKLEHVDSESKENAPASPKTPPPPEEMLPKTHYEQLISAQQDIIQKMKSDIGKMKKEYEKRMYVRPK
jgi:hypothetical protein